MFTNKDHLPWKKGALLWQCPECHAINAWNYNDRQRIQNRIKEMTYHSFGSCFDNICGHCQRDIVSVESPINSECYT